jgi:thiol-disulfide isomerase/thioredoxin
MAASSSGPPELVVYSRDYCHLCRDMIEALGSLETGLGFRLRVVEVDDDPALEQRYGELVPVLEGAGQEICHYVLDRAALDAFLAKFR